MVFIALQKNMKKLIILLLLPCFHSGMAIGETEENLNFALTAIQNNGKAIEQLVTKLDDIKTELREEIRQVRTVLGKEIQLIRNELGNETLAVKTRLRKESDEIQTQILALSNRLGEECDTLNSTILVNLASTTDSLVSEDRSSSSAIHKIIVDNRSNLHALLSNAFGIDFQGQEWITIQKRGTPLVAGRTREKFHNRTWTEYENGFGSEDGDFWIGLDKIHKLTKVGFKELRVDLEDWEGNKAYASYSFFKVSGSLYNYRLTVSGYSGNAGDSLDYQNGRQFSTMDRDHDNVSINCAAHYGPWWHNNCGLSQLNFEYQNQGGVEAYQGIIWYGWKGSQYSLKKTEIKIRRPASVN